MPRQETESDNTKTHPDAPDYEALARQYLDLWQDQFAAMSADPNTMETLSKMTDAWREATLSFLQGANTANPFGDLAASLGKKGTDDDTTNRAGGSGKTGHTPAGAATADGASDRSNGDVDALLRRITDLETRLTALERNATPEPKPKKKSKAKNPTRQS